MAAQSEARHWLDALEPRSLFEPREVPGSKTAVRALLARLAADPKTSGIERVHRGLYYKQKDHWAIDFSCNDLMRAAFRVAGPGAGMTRFTALNRLSWVWQVPNAIYLATVADKPPFTPLLPEVLWEVIPDAKHRLELSNAECSLLEAVRWTVWVEYEWDYLLDAITSTPERKCRFWMTLNSFGDGLRPDALREAAPLEKPTDLEMKALASCGHDHGVPLEERIKQAASAIESRYKAEVEGPVAI